MSAITWTAIAEWVPRGVLVWSTLYLARTLSPAEFGAVAFGQALVQLVGTAVDGGLSMFGNRESARQGTQVLPVANRVFGLRLASSFVGTGICLVAVSNADRADVLVWCLPYLIAVGFATDWLQRGVERTDLVALASTLGSFTLISGYLMFVRFPGDGQNAAIVWSLSFLVTSLAGLWMSRRALRLPLWPVVDFRAWVVYLRSSVFILASGIFAVAMLQLSVIFLGLTRGAEEVAHFVAPFRLTTAVATLGFVVPYALYPVLSSVAAFDRGASVKVARDLVRLMLIPGVLACAVLVAFSRMIMLASFGVNYGQDHWILAVLAFTVPLLLTVYVVEFSMLALGLERIRARSNFEAFVVVVVLAAVLVPTAGALGAGLSYVVGVTALGLFLQRQHAASSGSFVLSASLAIRFAVLGLLAAVALINLDLPWHLSIPLVGALYLLGAVALRLASTKDIATLRGTAPRPP